MYKYFLICLFVAYTWSTPWVLGIAMVRQESWRASFQNSSILVVKWVAPCLSYPNMSCWGVSLVSTEKGKMWGCLQMLQWDLMCLVTGPHASVWWGSLWTLDKLQCRLSDPFLRLDLNSTTSSRCVRLTVIALALASDHQHYVEKWV